jgi:hypothetical protein
MRKSAIFTNNMHTAPVTKLTKPTKSAVFIPTNLPAADPRDICDRSIARFKTGIALARKLRKEHGRGNVVLVVFGGWPLHNRLPLSIQHVYAACQIHHILNVDELDFVSSFGVNSVTDLHGTLSWMQEHIMNITDAYVVTSVGHATRLIAESDMYSLFENLYHIETHEHRGHAGEDEHWIDRAKNIPPHQYRISGRASDVTRFGTYDSLEWINKTYAWAETNAGLYSQYTSDVWDFVGELEANNVIVRSQTPGCWRLTINC